MPQAETLVPRGLRRILAGAAVLSLAAGAWSPAHPQSFRGKARARLAAPVAALGAVNGRVLYRAAAAARPMPAETGQQLEVGDQIQTRAGASAVVAFSDGTKIQVGARSKFTLEALQGRRVGVRLGIGLLEAWVKKVRGRQYRVRTPSAVASIRGTEFRVLVDRTGQATWDLFGGAINVTDNFGRSVPIEAGQRIVAEARAGLAPAPQSIPPTVELPPEPVVPIPAGPEAAPEGQHQPGEAPAEEAPPEETTQEKKPSDEAPPADEGSATEPQTLDLTTDQNAPPPPNPVQEQEAVVSPSSP